MDTKYKEFKTDVLTKEEKMRKRISFVALAFLLALASAYAQTTRYFVSVANNWYDNVSAYAINSSTGALIAVGGSPFAAGVNPHGGAIAAVTGP